MLGTYVSYKNNPYMVVEVNGKSIKLNSPVHGRVKVNVDNAVVMDKKPAEFVEYQHRKYLVTHKGNIFSLTSGRVVFGDEGNGNRNAILYLAGQLKGYSTPLL